MILLILIIVALLFSVGPWVLMLILGGLAHVLAIPALAIGFWPCVLLVLLFSFVGSFFRS